MRSVRQSIISAGLPALATGDDGVVPSAMARLATAVSDATRHEVMSSGAPAALLAALRHGLPSPRSPAAGEEEQEDGSRKVYGF